MAQLNRRYINFKEIYDEFERLNEIVDRLSKENLKLRERINEMEELLNGIAKEVDKSSEG